MGHTTKIEYCDSTTNPVVGCTGCRLYHHDPAKNHCYAAAMVNRWRNRKGWPKKFVLPEYYLERLEKALCWSDLTGTDRPGKPWLNGYPRIVFVNDLGDGFSPSVDPDRWLLPFLDRMIESPHIWLLLTKWPGRMIDWMEEHEAWADNFWYGTSVLDGSDQELNKAAQLAHFTRFLARYDTHPTTWVSYEPALGSLGLTDSVDGLRRVSRQTRILLGYIDWWVVGGESGSNARPAHPDWFRELRDATRSWGTPFFFKQRGQFIHTSQMLPGVHYTASEGRPQGDHFVRCTSKHVTGRLLDGSEWNEMPEVANDNPA